MERGVKYNNAGNIWYNFLKAIFESQQHWQGCAMEPTKKVPQPFGMTSSSTRADSLKYSPPVYNDTNPLSAIYRRKQ